jgi:MFS family permease
MNSESWSSLANWFLSLSAQELWTLILVAYVIAALVVGALCGYVADVKGRSVWSWIFLGFFCGIFALIAIAGTPVLTVETYKPEGWQDIERRLKAQRDDPENWTGRGGTQ